MFLLHRLRLLAYNQMCKKSSTNINVDEEEKDKPKTPENKVLQETTANLNESDRILLELAGKPCCKTKSKSEIGIKIDSKTMIQHRLKKCLSLSDLKKHISRMSIQKTIRTQKISNMKPDNRTTEKNKTNNMSSSGDSEKKGMYKSESKPHHRRGLRHSDGTTDESISSCDLFGFYKNSRRRRINPYELYFQSLKPIIGNHFHKLKNSGNKDTKNAVIVTKEDILTYPSSHHALKVIAPKRSLKKESRYMNGQLPMFDLHYRASRGRIQCSYLPTNQYKSCLDLSSRSEGTHCNLVNKAKHLRDRVVKKVSRSVSMSDAMVKTNSDDVILSAEQSQSMKTKTSSSKISLVSQAQVQKSVPIQRERACNTSQKIQISKRTQSQLQTEKRDTGHSARYDCTMHMERNREKSHRHFPAPVLLSRAIKNSLEFLTNKRKPAIKSTIRCVLLGIILTAWSPLVLLIGIGWLLSYPVRPCLFMERAPCYQNGLPWIIKFISRSVNGCYKTMTSLTHTSQGQTPRQHTNSVRTHRCRKHPDPGAKYSVFHANDRGWVIMPIRSSHLQNGARNFKNVFNNMLCNGNSSHQSNVSSFKARRNKVALRNKNTREPLNVKHAKQPIDKSSKTRQNSLETKIGPTVCPIPEVAKIKTKLQPNDDPNDSETDFVKWSSFFTPFMKIVDNYLAHSKSTTSKQQRSFKESQEVIAVELSETQCLRGPSSPCCKNTKCSKYSGQIIKDPEYYQSCRQCLIKDTDQFDNEYIKAIPDCKPAKLKPSCFGPFCNPPVIEKDACPCTTISETKTEVADEYIQLTKSTDIPTPDFLSCDCSHVKQANKKTSESIQLTKPNPEILSCDCSHVKEKTKCPGKSTKQTMAGSKKTIQKESSSQATHKHSCLCTENEATKRPQVNCKCPSKNAESQSNILYKTKQTNTGKKLKPGSSCECPLSEHTESPCGGSEVCKCHISKITTIGNDKIAQSEPSCFCSHKSAEVPMSSSSVIKGPRNDNVKSSGHNHRQKKEVGTSSKKPSKRGGSVTCKCISNNTDCPCHKIKEKYATAEEAKEIKPGSYCKCHLSKPGDPALYQFPIDENVRCQCYIRNRSEEANTTNENNDKPCPCAGSLVHKNPVCHSRYKTKETNATIGINQEVQPDLSGVSSHNKPTKRPGSGSIICKCPISHNSESPCPCLRRKKKGAHTMTCKNKKTKAYSSYDFPPSEPTDTPSSGTLVCKNSSCVNAESPYRNRRKTNEANTTCEANCRQSQIMEKTTSADMKSPLKKAKTISCSCAPNLVDACSEINDGLIKGISCSSQTCKKVTVIKVPSSISYNDKPPRNKKDTSPLRGTTRSIHKKDSTETKKPFSFFFRSKSNEKLSKEKLSKFKDIKSRGEQMSVARSSSKSDTEIVQKTKSNMPHKIIQTKKGTNRTILKNYNTADEQSELKNERTSADKPIQVSKETKTVHKLIQVTKIINYADKPIQVTKMNKLANKTSQNQNQRAGFKGFSRPLNRKKSSSSQTLKKKTTFALKTDSWSYNNEPHRMPRHRMRARFLANSILETIIGKSHIRVTTRNKRNKELFEKRINDNGSFEDLKDSYSNDALTKQIPIFTCTKIARRNRADKRKTVGSKPVDFSYFTMFKDLIDESFNKTYQSSNVCTHQKKTNRRFSKKKKCCQEDFDDCKCSSNEGIHKPSESVDCMCPQVCPKHQQDDSVLTECECPEKHPNGCGCTPKTKRKQILTECECPEKHPNECGCTPKTKQKRSLTECQCPEKHPNGCGCTLKTKLMRRFSRHSSHIIPDTSEPRHRSHIIPDTSEPDQFSQRSFYAPETNKLQQQRISRRSSLMSQRSLQKRVFRGVSDNPEVNQHQLLSQHSPKSSYQQQQVSQRSTNNPDMSQKQPSPKLSLKISKRGQAKLSSERNTNIPKASQKKLSSQHSSTNVAERSQPIFSSQRSTNVPERSQPTLSSQRSTNVPEKSQKKVSPQRSDNVPEKSQKKISPQRSANVPEKSQKNVSPQGSANVPEKNQKKMSPQRSANVPEESQKKVSPQRSANVPEKSQKKVSPQRSTNAPESIQPKLSSQRTSNSPISSPRKLSSQRNSNISATSPRQLSSQRNSNIPESSPKKLSSQRNSIIATSSPKKLSSQRNSNTREPSSQKLSEKRSSLSPGTVQRDSKYQNLNRRKQGSRTSMNRDRRINDPRKEDDNMSFATKQSLIKMCLKRKANLTPSTIKCLSDNLQFTKRRTRRVHQPRIIDHVKYDKKISKKQKDKCLIRKIPIKKKKEKPPRLFEHLRCGKRKQKEYKRKSAAKCMRKVIKKKPKRRRKWFRFGSKVCDDKEDSVNLNCSNLYLATLRERPWFWVYKCLPKCYPDFLRFRICSKTVCTQCAFSLTCFLWAPIFFCCFLCLRIFNCGFG